MIVVLEERKVEVGEREGGCSDRSGAEERVGEIGEREMVMGDDSGGLSANKANGKEEESSTTPFPERVWILFPSYIYTHRVSYISSYLYYTQRGTNFESPSRFLLPKLAIRSTNNYDL